MKFFLFDLIATQRTPEAQFHGGSEYTKFIFRKALDLGLKGFNVVINKNLPVDGEIELLINKKEFSLSIFYVEEAKDVKRIIEANNINFFFSGLPYIFGNLNLKRCNFIMAVLGLRMVELPSDRYSHLYFDSIFSRLKVWVSSFIKNLELPLSNFLIYRIKRQFVELLNNDSKKIITLSQHSKFSIINSFPLVRAEDIEVFPAPLNFKLVECNAPQEKDYFLIISGNRWIKNSYRAIKALDQLFSEGRLKNKHVVILGMNKDSYLFKQIANKKRFTIRNYLPKDELEAYFRYAFCLIYPTLNEGFGYPPIEAMRYGVPVICGANSSLFEVYGDSVSYFDSQSIGELRIRILQLNEDTSFRKELIVKGLNRVELLKTNQENSIEELISSIFHH